MIFENLLSIFEKINWNLIIRLGKSLGILIVGYLLFGIFLNFLKRKILKRVQRKKQISNIEIFFQALKYFIFVLLVIFAILSFTGSLTGIGLTAGLLSASLGWALQRPVTGVAAWVMVVFKRPFEIGDRILIGDIKGDISEISLTHIHISEIGGTIRSEETSGRIIMIPNAELFQKNVVNYTRTGEEILDVTSFRITYNSNLKTTEEIAVNTAKKVLRDYDIKKGVQKPYIRTFFKKDGVEIQLRFYTLATKREEISSKITRKIVEKIKEKEQVRFAYPHRQVIMENKSNE
ncbi:MAG: mechanosensitive ion channel family protein [Minisyncoccales bacterium]